MSSNAKHLHSIDAGHFKNTAGCETEIMPIPDVVKISMSQHIGAPCKPLVAKGDTVKVGQLIGDTDAFVSAPIHSSVSGTVVGIETQRSAVSGDDTLVVIETDKKQEMWEGIKAPEVNDLAGFVKAVRDSGLVGLGGASFPTHIKYNPKNIDEVHTLIVNGAECEPFITSDHRTMLEDTQDIIDGMKLIMEYIGLDQAYIGIEENKPDAIEKLDKMFAEQGLTNMHTFKLQARYPKGAERVLVYEITGQHMAAGVLPADLGVILSNVTSVAFVDQYFRDGIPLIKKRMTVDGDAVAQPKNIIAPIGTLIHDVIEFCGGYKQEPRKILMGGPMMGFPLKDLEVPMLKGSTGIIAIDTDETTEQACIKCGRCVDVCPMELSPLYFVKYADQENWEGMRDMHVMDCVECRCCQYICSSKISIIDRIKAGKNAVRGMK